MKLIDDRLVSGILLAVILGAASNHGLRADTVNKPTELRAAESEFREAWGGLTAEELAPEPVPERDNRVLVIQDAVEAYLGIERDDTEREFIGDVFVRLRTRGQTMNYHTRAVAPKE